MIRYPSPALADRNSPMITPTRHNPTFTFMLLMIRGTDEGISTFVRTSLFVPPRDCMSLILSWSVCMNPVCSVRMDPNTATDTAATIMVLI